MKMCWIAVLFVSYFTGSLALLATSSGRVAKGGWPPWSPEVREYIRYLKSLESGDDVLVQSSRKGSKVFLDAGRDSDEDDRPASPGNGTVMFLVLSDSNHYKNTLRWISQTWGQDLPASQLMAIGDAQKGIGDTNMRVQPTRCPAHTHDGACCKEAEAIITAHSLLKEQKSFNWAYIVDDDAYVRPGALQERLKTVDPSGQKNRGTLAAIPGCATKKCLKGFCGGGGAALSRQALTTLVGHSPATFLTQHMQTCDRCEMWGDVTVGTEAAEHDISVTNPGGLNGWLMPKNQFDSVLTQKSEPLMYHYIKSEGQMQFLHRLFTAPGTHQSNPQPASMTQGGNQQCATYKGNMQCSSDPRSLPWEHP